LRRSCFRSTGSTRVTTGTEDVIVRLLGGGDPPILVVDLKQTERFLRHSLVPLAPRVERDQEAKTVSSSVAL
jgi:hypothetical protein